MSHAPNAALLIDFDNVTLGVRSDLTKELRTLLNSDIIKGKVAVQRAYADWRRYPQYIVPLSESSIDLIFAPAFGTNKKNATDIRLAVDAVELVFTRPEIGTFILLSGDSDFSTLVIKLKEYGKYVIGVGIRESASDLLIQNCDEYYSYSDLAGLTKEVEPSSTQRDPWDVVREAITRMAQHGDVMRSDRLKQVMQQVDPNFDERNFGFNRFSKFVIEAGNKGALRLTKLENGQFEVGPMEPLPSAEGVRTEAATEDGARRGRRGGRGRGGKAAAKKAAPSKTTRSPKKAGRTSGRRLSLARAFELMRQALEEMDLPAPSEALRLRMITLHGREDQLLEEVRFERLLRQAHDAHVADVHKLENGTYEVARHGEVTEGSPGAARISAEPTTEAKPAVEAAAEPGEKVDGSRSGLRFRRGSRTPIRREDVPMVGVVAADDSGNAASKSATSPKTAKRKRSTRKKPTSTEKRTTTSRAKKTGTTKTSNQTAKRTVKKRRKKAATAKKATPSSKPAP
ncbi:MAG: NYN domain-containing protein [Gemmatimonadales bacterium]|nr:NYN domain-containing protein [Gemmatimonadales bacterium]